MCVPRSDGIKFGTIHGTEDNCADFKCSSLTSECKIFSVYYYMVYITLWSILLYGILLYGPATTFNNNISP